MTLPSDPVGSQVVRISYALGALDSVAVALRLLARWKSNAAFGADDFLGVVSLVPLYVMIAIGHTAVACGMGLHVVEVSQHQVSSLLKLMMAGVVTYCLTITVVKISILLLFRRIFTTAAFLTKTNWVGLLCIVWFFVTVFINVFQCHPFDAAFDITEFDSPAHCINIKNFYWAIAASNLGIDVVFLYLPLNEVWKLHLQRKQKLLLSGIFLMGGGVVIAGTMRLVTVGFLNSDLTFTATAQYTWSQVEPATAILCSSVVTYRPLLPKVIPYPTKLYSSFFSRGENRAADDTHNSSNNSKERTQTTFSEERDSIDWPGNGSDRDVWRLNAKVAEKSLHVIHVKLPPK